MFRITFYAPDEASANKYAQAAFDRIAKLNTILSDYLDDSELTKLSQSSGGPARPISPELYAVLDASLLAARQSDGAFDITLGPVIRLWRRARKRKELPTPDRIAETLARTGYQKLTLDPQARTAQLAQSGMVLDLGGIAKGYACDEAIRVLNSLGATRAMVDGGGGITVSNPPPGEDAWKIAIAIPGVPDFPPLHLHNCSVATSGDAAQFVEIAGKRYSHIVDPATGYGLTNRRQATIIAPLGMTADSLATAACILDPSQSIPLLDSLPHVSGFVVQITPNGQRKEWKSARWMEHTDSHQL